jgi:signal transduction histidine kinase
MFAHSITRKLMTVMLLTSSAVLFVTCGTFLTYELVTFRQTMVRTLSTLAQVIAANSTAALVFQNRAEATEVLSALAAEHDVVAAGVYDKSGTLFATYPATATPGTIPARPGHDGYSFGTRHLVLNIPVVVETRRLGTLHIQSDLGAMYRRLRLYGGMVAGVIVVSCLVAVVLSARLQNHISRPVLALARTAKTVSAQRDLSVRAERFDDDELGQLTDAFNGMLDRVQEQDRALREQGNQLRLEVDERGRAEAEVRALNADLERRVTERTHALEVANKELESFSYSVSHDLRAPLRHVLGYVEMLESETAGQLSAVSQRYMTTIKDATTEMAQLIDDLLTFSRMGRSELSESRVQLDVLVREAIRSLENVTNGHEIIWQTSPLPQVIGDRSMLKQVIANLLDNAVKYSRMRRPARIEIGCAGEERGRTIVFVRDNGAGFDMKYAGKLFSVFQRLHRADEFEGTGIGLATVQRIVARHGGRIWAESARDQGATFYLTLTPASHVGDV